MSFASAELLEQFSVMTVGSLPPFFAAAIEAIAHPVTIYDGEGSVVAMSAASRALHRLPDEEELPCPLSRFSEIIELRHEGVLLPTDEWPLVRALDGEPTSGLELRVRRHDTGAEWTARYTATPIRDAAGEIVLVVETAEDLRDEKQFEKALLTSEQRSRSIIDANIIGIISCGLDGQITEANDEFLRIVGRTREEVNAGRLRWDEMTPPEHLVKDQEAIAEARRQGFCRAYEKDYIHADGRRVPVLIGFGLLGDSKADAVAFILDLTVEKGAEEAMRRSEERYRSLVAATTSVVWSAGSTGEFTEPQPTWQAYTGQDWAEHRGFGWTRVLHPDDRDQVLATWKQSLETRTRFHSSGRIWHAPSASYRYFEARGVPIFGPDQQVREWIGTVVDTHENCLAQEAEHEARREAEAANRAKDEFLAVLSHELRTPLTPAFLSIDELMEMPNLPEAIRAELTVVRRNLGHETKLIDDLLDMTRIQSGKLELRFEFVDLHEVIQETAHDCLGDCRRKNIELHVELRAVRSEVRGDVVRLRQIFWNLLRNAIKFTSAGGRIEITTSTTETGQMLACVRDNGIGFPAGMEARLFSRFEQGGSEVTRRFGGLGLGLAISKSLVDLHGGTISASSDGPGKGATFCIQLATVASMPKVQQSITAPKPAASGVRILLVEDHDDTRITLARLLKRKGHEVLSAGSVSSALIVARAREFDLLISDIGLPDGDGFELLQQLPPTRAISLSGFGMEKDVAASKAAGFAAHLTKPVNFEQLATTINELLSEGT